jgi:drug/metabolite transporter (DMT)-like permease
MTAGVVGIVLASGLLHALWNLMVHSGEDRLRTMTIVGSTMAAAGAIVLACSSLPDRAVWKFVAISAAFELAYHLLLVGAYERGELSSMYPIARGTAPVLVLFGGNAFSSEPISYSMLVSVCCIGGGVLLLGLGPNVRLSGVLFAGAAGTCIAGYTVTDAIGVREASDGLVYIAAVFFLTGLPLPAILWRCRGPTVFQAPRIEVIKGVVAGAVSIAAYGSVIWAMQFGQMAMVAALRECSVLFAAVLGVWILQEAFTLRKLGGCLLLSAGLLALNVAVD